MAFYQLTKNTFLLTLTAFITVALVCAPNSTAQVLSDNSSSELEFTSNPDSLVAGRFEVGEELVFSLNINRYKLGDIFVLAEETGLMFDFNAYMETIQFAIEENPSQRSYEGWFIKREYTFALNLDDLNKPILTLKGELLTLDPKKVIFVDDILYVSEDYLQEWFGLEHEYKFNLLEISLKSAEPIPFEQNLARRGKTVSQRGRNEAIHPELFRGYGLLSPQIFDFSLRANYRDVNETASGGYGLIAARDVALVHANLFLSGTDTDPLSNARVNLSKVSNSSDLLGFLNASKIEVGDIRPVRQGFSRNQSRGVAITNATQNNNLDIQFTNISGGLQVGWDVELYQNGVLIGQEFAVESGQYEFLDVPLNFGDNTFEIIKYGPEGQILKEYKEQTIDKSFLQNSGLVYAASLSQSGESVFNTQKETAAFDAGYNFSTDIRSTIIPNVLLGFGFQTDFGGDFSQSQYTLSANSIVANKVAINGSFNINDSNQQTTTLGLRTSIGKHRVSGTYSYSSRDVQNNAKLDSHSLLLRNSGAISLLDKYRLSYNNEVRYDDNLSFTNLSANNSIGYSQAGFGIFHRIEYINREFEFFGEENIDELRGALTVQKAIGPVFSRLTASYGLSDNNKGLQSLQLASSWNISNHYRFKFDIDYNYLTEDIVSSLLFGWRHDNFKLYARAGYSDLSSWDFGLNASFSISAQPLIYGDTYITEREIAETGSLSVRVFLDKNLNAKIDPGEMVIPNVKVELKQALARGVTDENGIATLVGIPDQKLSDIVIDQETLPNPFLKPLVDGVSIRFRKGVADKLDFPVAMTSELEGLLFQDGARGLQPVARATINLVDAKGAVKAKVNSEYDGYFLFSGVFAGIYTLEVDEKFLTRKQLKEHTPIKVEIGSDSDLILIDDIILTEKTKFDGYLAVIAPFKSNAGLSLYLTLNNSVLADANLPLHTVEYQKQTLLTTGFYPNSEDAELACSEVISLGLTCEPKKYQYISNH